MSCSTTVRKHVSAGRRVILVGDLNVVASPMDLHEKLYDAGDPYVGYAKEDMEVGRSVGVWRRVRRGAGAHARLRDAPVVATTRH